ncbi:MFS transporter [Desulfocurvus sp. DL9XJH121]
MAIPRTLCNFGFATLNVFVLFAFSNLAVFFSFYSFLNQLPISPQWHGVLIGAFSGSALIVRPLISPWLDADNAIRAIAAGLALTMASLLLYAHAASLVPMLLLRIVHGTAYVIMMSAAVALLTIFMPEEKSGQGFGIVTIMTLLPYAVIPYMLGHGLSSVAGGAIYTYTALLMLVPGCLLPLLSKHVQKARTETAEARQPLSRGPLLANLRRPKILVLLLANGLVFCVFSSMFFFLKTFCATAGLGDPGLFFSAATCVMIATRLFLGPLFDRFDKGILGAASLLLFAGGMLMLRSMNSLAVFYAAAVLFGVGVGSASPLMNALMFTISPPQYRGLNTNLMIEMVDAGFVIGPTACGLALAAGFGFTSIWGACVAALVLSAGLMGLLKNSNTPQSHD